MFRAEVLFVHGIHPSTPGASLDRATIEAIWDTLARWLRDGVRRNRIVTNTLAEPLHVYHHDVCGVCGLTARRPRRRRPQDRRVPDVPTCATVSIHDLTTPALLVDSEAFDHNIAHDGRGMAGHEAAPARQGVEVDRAGATAARQRPHRVLLRDATRGGRHGRSRPR